MTPLRPGAVSACTHSLAKDIFAAAGPIPAPSTITGIAWTVEPTTQFVKQQQWLIGFVIVATPELSAANWTTGTPLFPAQSNELLDLKPALPYWSIRPRSASGTVRHDIHSGPRWILARALGGTADSIALTISAPYEPIRGGLGTLLGAHAQQIETPADVEPPPPGPPQEQQLPRVDI